LSVSRQCEWNALEKVSTRLNPDLLHLPCKRTDYTGTNEAYLSVGKQAIKFNIPEAEAVERLVDLIKEHNKWVEPETKETP